MLDDEKIKHGVITGETDGDARAKAINDFQADKTRVFVMTTASGGAGVNLHDIRGEFPRISFIMPNDNSTLIKQASGRAGGRAGGKTKSITKFVFVKDTHEERIGMNMEKKLHFIDMLNDGDLKMNFQFGEKLLQ
jgi:SNF2 family DNA or RNA helicase